MEIINGEIIVDKDIELSSLGKGIIIKSLNGIKWKITVSNLGILSTAQI